MKNNHTRLCLKPLLLKHNIWAKTKVGAILIDMCMEAEWKMDAEEGHVEGDRKQCCGRSQGVQ
jgi:hypothetical protein